MKPYIRFWKNSKLKSKAIKRKIRSYTKKNKHKDHTKWLSKNIKKTIWQYTLKKLLKTKIKIEWWKKK